MSDKIAKYEMYVQKYLISDTYFMHSALRKGLTSEWFSEGVAYYFAECIIGHYKEYSAVITRDIIRQILEDNKQPESTIALYESYYDAITALEDDDSHNFDFWFEILKHEFTGRQVKNALFVTVNSLQKDNKDYKKAVTLLENQINSIKQTIESFEEGYTLKDTAEERWQDYLRRKANPDLVKGILTGYRFIDEQTRGVFGGTLNLWTARSGVGKSIALQNIAHNAFIDGHNIFYGSIEMDAELCNRRFDSLMADVPINFLNFGQLNDEEEERYKQILDIQRYMKNEFYIAPQNSCTTPKRLELEIKQYIDKYGKIDLLAIDYLNIMTLENTKGMASHEIQRALAEELRWLAINYGFVCWSAVQSNRESLKLKSNQKDGGMIVSGSDFIVNTADLAISLEEKDDDDQLGLITATVVKGRNLQKTSAKLRKNYKKMKISDLDGEYDGVSN